MDRQKEFDLALAHIRKQGRPAIGMGANGRASCRYRTVDGAMCIIGARIPDDRHTPDMEVKSAAALVRQYNLGSVFGLGDVNEPTADTDFLNSLQAVHDEAAHVAMHGADFMQEFEHAARLFALKQYLIYREPVPAWILHRITR